MRASKPITSAQINALSARIRQQWIPRTTADVARRVLSGWQTRGPHTQLVDGIEGAPLDSVKFGGRIEFRFPDIAPVLDWIYPELVHRSPIGPERGLPHYYQEHWLFIDGVKADVMEGEQNLQVTGRAECRFVNARPYARRLEHGWSVQAPDGVYELVSLEARDKFPWASIEFEYVGEEDVPAPIPWPVKSWYRFPSITVKATQ